MYYLGFFSIIGVSTRSLFIVNYTIFHMSKHEKGKIGVTIPVFGNGSEDINELITSGLQPFFLSSPRNSSRKQSLLTGMSRSVIHDFAYLETIHLSK